MQWRLASAPLPSQKIRELVYAVLRITLHTAESPWLPAMSWGKKRGNATIIYRTAFPVGDCVLVYLSSLLIHGLLFWLNDDGGAILGERLTKHSSGLPTILLLAESLLSTKPSLDNASLSSPPSIPMSTFRLLRFTCKRTAFTIHVSAFALYKVLCSY
ncbi:unnamed protein product [Rangifer tarandus platyrhynchus]|uniref:Uncharacterized protein n=2 Tax=Rangifer tarandus platyrhynchus TaxID=3082113 RepID=A0ABN8YHX7_RANTA|nr:unnamed protein product [Rangifer tarandus platyrhynchus]